ncbi:MAG: glycosyltransferase family A protein [Patescibacteria group bacterium]
MKVSVVIPVFNEEKYIGQCLDSLTKQTELPNEIIIVDNNCTDKTISIAKKYKVKIVKESKQGISYARNKGYNQARGDIIARCDADCILNPNWIKKIKYNFEKNKNIAGLIGPLQFYDLRLKNVMPFFKFYILTMKKLIGEYPFSGPNMSISKDAWNLVKNEVCLNDKLFHEDIDLSIHVAKSKGTIIYDNKLMVYFSARRIKNQPESFFKEYPERVIKTYYKHFPQTIESQFILINAKLFVQSIQSVYSFFNSSNDVVSDGNLSSLKRSKRGKRKASPAL